MGSSVAVSAIRVSAAESAGWRLLGVFERAFALALLLLFLPVLAIAVVTTALLSGDSPLVAHARVGRGGRRLWVIKLRTMWGAEPKSGRLFVHRLNGTYVPERKCAGDERITSRFAAFCRHYSIDEIPQLWQVVRGEMALVGPRPITAEELEKHYGDCKDEVLRVAPGLTGLWQVMGRNALTYRQRRTLDLFLVRRWSAGLYLFVLAGTVRAVLFGGE
jgi:lipopolysaccharide/colanic/teichoic acid biosynthesis glycosyltransferase